MPDGSATMREETQIHAHYLVLGAGATGMAFVDSLLTEWEKSSSKDKTIVMVDAHDKPGGHWNDAYPFVTLHQPSRYYGVNSKTLEKDPSNELEVSTKDEILQYYDGVMQERFLKSGRVQYFSLCKWSKDGELKQAYAESAERLKKEAAAAAKTEKEASASTEADENRSTSTACTETSTATHVYDCLKEFRFFSSADSEKKYVVSGPSGDGWVLKVVDTTYLHVEVPSISPAVQAGRFSIEEGADATLVPVNDVVKYVGEGPEAGTKSQFVIIGGGKTSIDAVLYVLKHGVDPAAIHWIMPRDSWLLMREVFRTQSYIDLFDLDKFVDCWAQAQSVDDMFLLGEKEGIYARIDDSVTPEQWKCATVTRAEMEELRKIPKENMLRGCGRLQTIGKDKMVFKKDGKEVAMDASSTLYVDCSSCGLPTKPLVPVFNGNLITLQPLVTCQVVFSAAFIAFIEGSEKLAYRSLPKESDLAREAAKNKLCLPLAYPNVPLDDCKSNVRTETTCDLWEADRTVRKWIVKARLFEAARPQLKFTTWQTMKFCWKNRRFLMTDYKGRFERALDNLRKLSGEAEGYWARPY